MNRQQLRRAISQELGEPFFLDMPQGYATKLSGASPFPQELWEDKPNKLARAWIYFTTGANAGVERRIKRYNRDTGVITLDPPLTGSWLDTDEFEVHKHGSATFKNQAINTAIRELAPLYHTLSEYEITIPERDGDGNVILELDIPYDDEDDVERMPTVEDITRAWHVRSTGQPRRVVDDLGIIHDGESVVKVILPFWIAVQSGTTLILEGINRPSVLNTETAELMDAAVRYVQLKVMGLVLMTKGTFAPERDWQDEKWRGQLYMSEADGMKKMLKKGQPLRTRWTYDSKPTYSVYRGR